MLDMLSLSPIISLSRFEYGIGSQVMLSSAVFAPVRDQLMDTARKVLTNPDEIEAIKRRLDDVRKVLMIG